MWKLRKGREKVRSALNAKLVAGILWLQQRWAGFMTKKAERLSPRQKKIALAIFCIVFSGTSVCVFIQAVKPGLPEKRAARKIDTRKPIYSPLPPEPILSDRDKAAIRAFRHLVDSLSATSEGNQQLRKFFEGHPGLADSLSAAEQLIDNNLNTQGHGRTETGEQGRP